MYSVSSTANTTEKIVSLRDRNSLEVSSFWRLLGKLAIYKVNNEIDFHQGINTYILLFILIVIKY